MEETRPGPLIAIVGSDGAGKSTVCTAMLAWMRQSRPTELCHLGKKTGHIGRGIARLPIVGRKLDRTIVSRSSKARSEAGPGLFTALVVYAISMRRVRKFRRMLALRRRGIAVLTDRFPQNEVPGPMDGPGLLAEQARHPLVRFLTRRERAHYARMARCVPDLVIRLNVDLVTAMARKPDHRPSSLRRKVETIGLLTFGGAPIVDLDATEPLPEVLSKAKEAIAATLARF